MAEDDDDDKSYEVGYGKPPKSGQIKPGERRNPKGRPRTPRPEPGLTMLEDFIAMGRREAEFVDKSTGQKMTLRPRDAVLQNIWSEGTKDLKTSWEILHIHRSERSEGREQKKWNREDEALFERMVKRFSSYADKEGTPTNTQTEETPAEANDLKPADSGGGEDE